MKEVLYFGAPCWPPGGRWRCDAEPRPRALTLNSHSPARPAGGRSDRHDPQKEGQILLGRPPVRPQHARHEATRDRTQSLMFVHHNSETLA
jgi:hypothetical protein